MADVLNNSAITGLASWLLGLTTPATVPKLCLFVNNETFQCNTVPGDLVECTATGYARITLTPATWDFDISVTCQTTCTYPEVTFTFTAGLGQTVYGHYVLDTASGDILWGQTWGTPFAIPAGGGTVKVDLEYLSKQCSG